MIRLYVNVDHVATIREARKTFEPDPLQAALLAEKAGAHGITVHLREDRRHIQDHDVERIRSGIKTPLNLEMAATEEMIAIALKTQPDQVSLVPEKREEITTEGGLNVVAQEKHLISVQKSMTGAGIKFSLFIDPDRAQVEAAHRVGARSIEFNTGRYSESLTPNDREKNLEALLQASQHAASLGVRVFAGHGLTVDNVGPIAAIHEVEELNIGHHLVSQSVYHGLEKAIQRMIQAIENGVSQRP